jgi:RNA polymerase sigma-70 factor (ECF subfamily)
MDAVDYSESSGELFAVVYDNLRRLAVQHLAKERADHTLQATALVHEVYLKLAGEDRERWADSAHFFNTAAGAMRRVLVDHARARRRDKRGGGMVRVPLTEVVTLAALAEDADPEDILNVDAALTRLERISPEAGAVIRLRFFTGLSVDQAAVVLGLTPRTVARKWAYARAWLRNQLAIDGDTRPG